MKKYAKILVIVGFIIITGINLLIGCSNRTVDTQNDQAQQQEVITINWMPQNDQPVDPESPVVKELERQLNVKFNFIYIDRNKETELLNIRIASEEIPDVMRLRDDRFRAFIQQGVLAEIPEELLKDTAPTFYEVTEKYGGDMAWEYPKEDGKLYGLPLINPNGDYHFVPIWRDDWLRNVGIDKVPETLEEAEEVFYRFVNNDPDQNGKKDTYALSDKGMSTIFGAFGGIPYQSVGGSNGFTWSLKDGEVIATAVMPEMKDALTLLNKWYKDGLIDPEFISGENKGQGWSSTVTFWNGKIGFSTPGVGYHINPPYSSEDSGSANYQNFKSLQGEKATYKEGKPLVGPKGHFGTERWGTYPGVYMVLGRDVAKDEEKMKKVLEINEKMCSDYDFYMLVRYGIKDLHYKVTDIGVVYTDLTKDNKDKAKLGLNTNGIGYAVTNNVEFHKRSAIAFCNYLDKHKHTDNYVNVVWGGLPSYPQYKAAIDKKIKENYFLFITGERSLDEFDKFVDELNKAGLEELTVEANEWYTKYNKK